MQKKTGNQKMNSKQKKTFGVEEGVPYVYPVGYLTTVPAEIPGFGGVPYGVDPIRSAKGLDLYS